MRATPYVLLLILAVSGITDSWHTSNAAPKKIIVG